MSADERKRQQVLDDLEAKERAERERMDRIRKQVGTEVWCWSLGF